MKNISELCAAASDTLEIFEMPGVRIIGIARQCTFENDAAGISPHETYWKEFFAYGEAVKKLPLIMKDAMVCWTGDSPKGSPYYTYMPGVMCPAGTPVPEGLDFRDLPASCAAKGKFGHEVGEIVRWFMPLGFNTCPGDTAWNAKLFFGDEEIQNHNNAPCRWLVPCVKAEEPKRAAIEDVITGSLGGTARENALAFAAYLNQIQLSPDVSDWGKFSHNGYNIGHMWVEDHDWMVEIFDYLHFGEFTDEDEAFVKAVHDHVNICQTPCHDECWRGKDAKIFGKEFKSVCSQHSRAFVNPEGETIGHLKKLIEYSRKTTPYTQQWHPNTARWRRHIPAQKTQPEGAGLIKLQIIDIPLLKVVGKEIRVNMTEIFQRNPLPRFWDACFADGIVETLDALVAYSFNSDYMGWMGEWDENRNMTYIAGMLVRPECPVPEGYTSRDIAPCKAAVGWIRGKDAVEVCRPAHRMTSDALRAAGYTSTNTPWCAEVMNFPRFTNPDENGLITLDYYIPVDG